ncbi:hypothetical protein [Cognataquiflexum rubidum]|uniref:hypothetical protein n=1 Tax=Cognataquiflexum rubidum TaxID=2922273 RepID=UPI001F13848C|nr:hypothetical protein [Cognataquiflexum rubidum]MCH6232610.1 hypothetical protein [Cognataquiflexum rubidum]
MKKLISLPIIVGLVLISFSSFSQREDSVSRKNVIKYNLSTPALYNSAFLFQYERVLNPNRSLSVQVGHITLPELLTRFENVQKISNAEQFGYNVTVDYRFYLAKENKYNAPRGVYIAPFASIHHFKNVKDFELKSSETNEFETVTLTSKVNILSAGVALGYQFVVWDRMTLDFLVLGPSISNYNVEMALDGDLPPVELDENLQLILEHIVDRLPFIDRLLEDRVADFDGRTNISTMGFRYSVGIGFRF